MIVHLVGAGPGDPLLLTRGAADVIAAADVVVADRHSADAVVALAPPGAERIFVGRTPESPAWPLDRIVDLLVARAATGATVVRLKSGDPFVCSRGAEEAEALAAAGVTVVAVPGVSAATAAPLAAGLPPGRRVVVASGDDDPVAVPVDWAALADPSTSIVVLTGRAHQGAIAAALVAGGLAPATPAAVVHGAGRPGQQVVHTSLSDLGSTRLPPPAGVVVGAHP